MFEILHDALREHEECDDEDDDLIERERHKGRVYQIRKSEYGYRDS
jgi:hypothetical protein